MAITITKKSILIAMAIVVVVLAVVLALYTKDTRIFIKQPQASAHFVGSGACQSCHQNQSDEWKISDHHRAMEVANEQTVLGNFNNVTFNYFGRKTVFSKKDNEFLVSTENQQGKNETFAVVYTLGYKPLQQYLVKFNDGRIQALPFAWDTRKKEEGGQRWFHLYPDDNIKPENPLFWTRPLQNWNHMCADCHTTDFSKNFSDQGNSFNSHWQEAGNGCESCHGAGSAHIDLMQSQDKNKKSELPESDLLTKKLTTQTEQIDQCGVCHARREMFKHGLSEKTDLFEKNSGHEKIMQTWQPDLLRPMLYFPDGQIRDEVFEIGSFMQSKMYAAGVTCSNCHNPHTTKLKAEGNALCTQCHVKETYDTDKHHFHPAQSNGAQCVSCHMPTRTYMVVNPRHDHRFSVPRPDLGETTDVPNTCVACHENKTNGWAAKEIRKHFGNIRPEHFGKILWDARHEQLAADTALEKMLREQQYNPIVRATSFVELINYPNPATLPLIAEQLKGDDPLIRLGAVQSLGAVPPEQRTALLLTVLNDPSRAVRLAIAPLIVGVDKKQLTSAQQSQLQVIYAEYKNWLDADRDRGPALVALAGFYLAQGDTESAQQFFQKALQRDDKSLAAYLNYADFYRSTNRDAEAEQLLHQALVIYPDSPDAHYALGLLLVRKQHQSEALSQLHQAMQLAPENSHYAYVYGIGLYSSGQQEKGLSILKDAQAKFPANTQILSALVSYYAERNDRERAQDYGQKLQRLTRQ